MDIRTITFDFWNTLAVDSAPVKVRELSAQRMMTLLKGAGINTECRNVLTAFAECRKLCYSFQEDKGIDFTPKEQMDWIMDYLGVKPEEGLWNELFDAYTTSLLDIPPGFPKGLGGVLKELRKRYKLAIICNTGRTPGWVVRSVLDNSGLKQYFDVLVFSNEVGVAKPNPYIFRIASRILNEKPENILHIGDHLLTDVAGSRGAGFKAAWYNPEEIDQKVECDLTIKDFSELLKIQ
ncbi:MAG: HAD family hydrolase [Bacillota bacterium]|nr:HAD family hydrolase [Bacillota bacterium]MDD3298757.1 HAD family hydrolase [Bacillota bacterium]MDD3850889.1 HAD family hydrolase [Bacillota bacterium]MDD4707845.1 HAD family hydrolase [Bacillota bacterium]